MQEIHGVREMKKGKSGSSARTLRDVARARMRITPDADDDDRSDAPSRADRQSGRAPAGRMVRYRRARSSGRRNAYRGTGRKREGSRWTCASPKTGQRHRINNSGADAQALDSDFQPSLSESDCTALSRSPASSNEMLWPSASISPLKIRALPSAGLPLEPRTWPEGMSSFVLRQDVPASGSSSMAK